MKKTFAAILALGLATAVPLAHAGSHADPVNDRMQLMKTVGAQTKILGTIAKGEFDGAAVQAAAATLAEAAAMIPAKFESNAMNAESEALPLIWENFEDFTAKGMMLEAGAKLAMAATDGASLGAAMGQIGGSCKACHADYRK